MPDTKRIRSLFTTSMLKNLSYIGAVPRNIRNWIPFLLAYSGLDPIGRTYVLRSGIRIKTQAAVDTANIAIIFLKKDYGDIDDNSIVIDVGANIGIFALYAAATSKNTTIYAYEPGVESYKRLLENVSLNRLEHQIISFPLGVAARQGKRQLYISENDSFHSLYSHQTKKNPIEIECTTLQAIFDDNQITVCDLLKLDCEGAEFEILYSTSDSYLRRIRNIRLEYHNQALARKDYDIRVLIKFLQERGFRIVKSREDSIWAGIVWLERDENSR